MAFNGKSPGLRAALALAGFAGTLASPAWGSTFVLMTDEELATHCDVAWLGTVESVVYGMTSDQAIHTYVTLVADEQLKGSLPPRITLRELGGRVGEVGQVVFGAPSYAPGEQVVVFLEQVTDGTFRTYQLGMGKFSVQQDPETGELMAVRDWGRNPSGIALARAQSGQLSAAEPDSRPLARLIETIRRVAASQPGRSLPRPAVLHPDELEAANIEVESAPFTFLSPTARWPEFDTTGSVAFLIDSTPPVGIAGSGVTEMERAMVAWRHATTNNTVVNGGFTGKQGFTCASPNRIIFDDPANEITNPTGCSGTLAIGGICTGPGTTTVNGVTFQNIARGLVVFNDGWSGCAIWNGEVFAETGAHELGHALGFGHGSENPSEPDTSLQEALMYFQIHGDGRGASSTTMTRQDDKMAAAFSYPKAVNPALFVLDGFGGLHPGGTAASPSPPPPYFGFDIARDLVLTGANKGFVLDGFGGVHAFGGEALPSPATPYFGFDVASAIARVPGTNMFYVLDDFGGVHRGNGAAAAGGIPYFGFDIARDIEARANGAVYVLDGFGGVHAGGAATAISPAAPYFGFDIARDLKLTTGGNRYYVLDGFGGVHRAGYPAMISPAPPYFGFDASARVLLSQDDVAVLVVDRFGGIHRAGGGSVPSPSTPYFGFDIVRAASVSFTVAGTPAPQ